MPAVRPSFHLTPCSKFRSHLYSRINRGHVGKTAIGSEAPLALDKNRWRGASSGSKYPLISTAPLCLTNFALSAWQDGVQHGGNRPHTILSVGAYLLEKANA